MAEPIHADSPPDRATLLRDARRRLAQLEIETHRLRAELARLEARGEDEAAARLTEQLEREEERLAEDRDLLRGEGIQPTRPVSAGIDSRQSNPDEPFTPTAVPPVDNPADAQVSPEFGALSQGPRTKSTSRKRSKKRRLKPAWTVSLAAHLALVVLLGCVTFGLPLDQTRFLLANATDGEDFDDFVEISLEAEESDEPPLDLELDPLATLPLDEPALATIDAALFADVSDYAVTQVTAIETLPSDASGLMQAAGISGAGGETGDGSESGAGSAQFFGARAQGNRFVFVVDNSGSMTGGRMETTFFELLNSIGGMKPKQEFHVLFYSDQVYPMFFPQPANELIAATRANKGRLEQWLASVQMCKGDCLTDAMDQAAALRPHVVYLLSDGGYLFTGKGAERKKSGKLEYLTEQTDHWQFTVHTLGMTVRNADAAEGLTLIARAHGGTFTPVGVRPAAALLAKQKRIPYNRTPGQLWGSEVR
ncbi:hypothetical protein KOR34_09400 [Posidoniimonas corsicana]|uniref:Uncharacterized protein n=1 Tax=Posidoniimonas corsicana TaxID=1938618 RepID=A0A5C5VCS8_9BACT|nr:VWA domain-containing protein [Posidoniimonas corsicana]TWT36041.1 hypothetical protein KOR34_09400 [Posidoniimonas corsicana]